MGAYEWATPEFLEEAANLMDDIRKRPWTETHPDTMRELAIHGLISVVNDHRCPAEDRVRAAQELLAIAAAREAANTQPKRRWWIFTRR